MPKVITYFKEHLYLLCALIFVAALFFRVYNISHHMAYEHDQVRDLKYVQNYFENGQFFLAGPKSSIGDLYLPPFWYYLMNIAYIFSPSPLSPSLFVALLSSLTASLIYLFTRKFFNESAALIAAFLYIVSPLSIEYSRFAWNPNPVPFFTMCTLLGLYYFLFEKKEWGFYATIIGTNLAVQLHYQGIIMWLFALVAMIMYKKVTIKRTFLFIVINALLLLPFFIHLLTKSPTQGNTGGIENALHFLLTGKLHLKNWGMAFADVIGRTAFFSNTIVGGIAFVAILGSLVLKTHSKEEQLLKYIFITTFVFILMYRGFILGYYILFLIPIVIIYIAVMSTKYLGKRALFAIIPLIVINTIVSPAFGLRNDVYYEINRVVQTISQTPKYCVDYKIFDESDTKNKFDYLFSIAKNPPQTTNCDTIYYVCEEIKCPNTTYTLDEKKVINTSIRVKVYKVK